MPGHYAYNAYLQAKVQPETDPKRLILMLYEGALEHLTFAREGIAEHDARKRGEHLSRAVAIVSELYTVLEPRSADESIAFLRGLYQSILVALAQATVTHDVQTLMQAYRYLERLKDVWEHQVMGLKAPDLPTALPSEVLTTATVTTSAPRLRAYGGQLALGQRSFSV